jgi:hypothetical protein
MHLVFHSYSESEKFSCSDNVLSEQITSKAFSEFSKLYSNEMDEVFELRKLEKECVYKRKEILNKLKGKFQSYAVTFEIENPELFI